jgi:raffinose/stachyose/melibiose transport system permease protein
MKTRTGKVILESLMVVLAVIYFFPLYLTFANSLKSLAQVMLSTASLPNPIMWSNYSKAWTQINFPRAFFNTFIVTVLSIFGIVLISSLSAYKLVRAPCRLSSIIFIVILSAMIIPFHTLMISIVRIANILRISNSHQGLIFFNIGFGIPFAFFMYHGFVKTVPRELEEAATIDGCGTYRKFFIIVFPLLIPVTATIIVLDVLWIWNDFMLPLLLLSSSAKRTLTLSYFFYFGQYVNQWHMALAALTMSILPTIIFYIFVQRYIIKGIASGALKG